MGATEVEIKFYVHNTERLVHHLNAAGFTLKTPRTHEMNTLYDTPDQAVRRRGELIRIRKYGDTWTVTHKGKGSTGRHKSRAETETVVTDGETLAAIFKAAGLEPSFRYEKYRAEWSDKHGHVVIDETPIGNIAEIEGPADWIDRTAQKLGIQEKDYVTSSYGTLFQEWKKKTGSSAEEMTFAAIAPLL